MSKTLAEHLHVPKQQTPSHITYYLDDVLEKNPTKYCPNCTSTKIEILHTHNVDGTDYHCNSCRSTYELVMYTKSEEFGH